MEIIGLYLMFGFLFSLWCSLDSLEKDDPEIPFSAYVATALVWPYTVYLIIKIVRKNLK